MPSFFRMELNYPIPDTRPWLFAVNEEDISVLIHEYIHFLLDIVRKGNVLHNSLLSRYIKIIGTPIIKDSNENYWVKPPLTKSEEIYRIEYFPAIEHVYNCLFEGNDICEMITWCEKSPKVDVNDNCYQSPWNRISDTRHCPFATLWKNWNLEGYLPVSE